MEHLVRHMERLQRFGSRKQLHLPQKFTRRYFVHYHIICRGQGQTMQVVAYIGQLA